MPAEPPVPLWPDPEATGPLTDLYELTMMAGYASEGMADTSATFELFVRRLPANRAYLIVGAGRFERGNQIVRHRRRERIHLLGTVERDRQYARVDFVSDRRVVHSSLQRQQLRFAPRSTPSR